MEPAGAMSASLPGTVGDCAATCRDTGDGGQFSGECGVYGLLEMAGRDLLRIGAIIHRSHVDDFPIFVEYEEFRCVNGAVAVGDLLGFIDQVEEGELFLPGSLGHFLQRFGGFAIGVDGDEHDSRGCVREFPGEFDQAILVVN